MYGCENWTLKNTECQRINTFIVVLEKTLKSPLDYKKIKPVNLKGNQPWIFIGRTDAELKIQYFGLLIHRADSLEKTLMLGKIEGKRRRAQQRMRWLDSITVSMDVNFSKLQVIVNDREAWHAAISGITKSWTLLGTEQQRTSLLCWTVFQ